MMTAQLSKFAKKKSFNCALNIGELYSMQIME